ncbi:MAG: aspartate 1-decarboxylase [Candidatus Mcinerneyibacterium aminivorans]|uniref:Aspartate 1-decarboxylase n=1 Tax=Candidatus Mcinerneyibacterium aminivorans TaxID=2703815 RepID=A0A5D0MD45_9BACT|nr:MAG: aspartate 1-decarboxylase [Candidatus Mcinerneyibacterium aminivorans]
MLVKLMKSKIHTATVTESNLDYEGSITIDAELIEKANFYVGEKVQVLNKNTGDRIETYIIEGKRNSGEICLNGPAARNGEVGDEVIIISYAFMPPEEAENFKPTVLLIDEKNKIKKQK